MLKIYNTLTRKVENFTPIIKDAVGLYTCGPTVYDYPHIGNLRTFVFSDILVRILIQNDFKVTSIQNITDIDDKIITKARDKNIPMGDFTARYEKHFRQDTEKLNIKDKDRMPHATEYIDKMISYIKVLLEKDLAYVEGDGSVYFDISKFTDYGKLSRIDKENLMTGTRTLSDEYEKDNIQDFALWKSEKEDEVGYDSPWGWGRPGWHLECSVMSQDNLGDTFDIHVGGVDLIFPHHENEIAQSEGKTGKKFVNYFIHGAHMLVDGRKMSKSLGNFYTISDIEENGFDALALRYLYLQTHYRQEMNFTWVALDGAQNALNRLRGEFGAWEGAKSSCPEFEKRFKKAINDDLNMPEALAVMWEMVRSSHPDYAKKNCLLRMDKVLGLGFANYREEKIDVPASVNTLVEEREKLGKSV